MSSTSSRDLIAPFAEACNYPGRLDEREVEHHLARYLSALGIKRKIVRLRQGWTLDEHPPLRKYVYEVMERIRPSDKPARDARDALAALAALDARAALAAQAARAAQEARDALAARDAQDARDARDAQAARDALAARAALDALDARAAQAALDARDAQAALDARDARAANLVISRFAAWCVQAYGWWWWRFDLSWLATTFIGARQLGSATVAEWSEPIYQAFLAGAWILHFTEDTLYWVAKPRVHVDDRRRLQNADNYAALESDVENLYFVRGVLVPAYVVVRPDWITVREILEERNAELRRIMIERYGQDRFMVDAGASVIDKGVDGELLAIDLPGDPDGRIVTLRLRCPSTSAVYIIRVPPDQKDYVAAKAWTFGLKKSEYVFASET